MELKEFKEILGSSKTYQINERGQLAITQLTITQHYSRKSVILDLSKIDEELLRALIVESEEELGLGCRKVRIRSLEWYEENKNINEEAILEYRLSFIREMSTYCGEEAYIKEIDEDGDLILMDMKGEEMPYFWSEWMFEPSNNQES